MVAMVIYKDKTMTITPVNKNLPLWLNCFEAFIIQATLFYMPIYLKELGYSGIQIGALMGLFSITGLLLIIPLGILNDRIKTKYLITGAIVCISISFFSLLYTRDFSTLFLTLLVLGAGISGFDISIGSLVMKTLAHEKRALTMSLFNFSRMTGNSLSLLLGALCLQYYSFSHVYAAAAISGVLLLIPCFLLPSTSTSVVSILDYKKDFLRKEVLSFTLVIFLIANHWGAESTAYSLFLKQDLGLSWIGVGVYMGIPIFALALSSLSVGKILQKTQSFRMLLFYGAMLSGVCHVLMTIPNLWISFPMRILHEMGDAVILTVMFFGVSSMFSSEKVGGLSAVFNLINKVSAFIGALMYGPMGEYYGYNVPLSVSGALTCFAAILLLILFPAENRTKSEIPV
jgi:predicted MFS family arabinose efflux permease